MVLKPQAGNESNCHQCEHEFVGLEFTDEAANEKEDVNELLRKAANSHWA